MGDLDKTNDSNDAAAPGRGNGAPVSALDRNAPRDEHDATVADEATASGDESAEERAPSIVSDDMLIIIPVRNLVLFPGIVLPVAINREASLAAAKEAVRAQRKVGFLLQRDAEKDEVGQDDLYTIGTEASILRYVTAQDGTHHVVVQGERRFRVLDFQNGLPFLVARVDYL